MKVSYKKILIVQGVNDSVNKLGYSAEDYAVVSKLNRLVKKLVPFIEEMQEQVEDLRLDHCMKDGLKIVRENGQLQWTAEGEKAFRKAYKQLLETEIEVELSAIKYSELAEMLPKNSGLGEWDDVRDSLSPFFE
jgi:hypothetical protein